jgi:hypothetical protein
VTVSVGGGAESNVAVTVVSEVSTTVHVPVPLQPPPDQPEKSEPNAGAGVNVMLAPYVKSDAHVRPQSIPAGADVTVPVPVPAGVTVKVDGGGRRSKVAVTVESALSTTVHVPVPLHPPPDQPEKSEEEAAAAVSVMLVPCANDDAQVAPQLIPDGAEVTMPVPAPAGVTVNVCGPMKNVAVTVVSAFNTTVHVPVPLHPPPDQPENTEPAAAAAVNVTLVPCANDAAQVPPQLTPDGADVTEPLPAPAGVTVNVCSPIKNVAVTVVSAFNTTVHVPVPLHPPPDQPENTEPAADVAVNVIDVPWLNVATQVTPHVIPAGADVTLPVPAPAGVTVNTAVAIANDAVTAVFALSVRVQVPVPLHPPPDQPENTEPAAGAAVSVTLDPVAKSAAHVTPHVMPAGAEATLPLPAPLRRTVNVDGARLNVAVTVVFAFNTTAQVPVPLHPPPDQPANTEPEIGVAVSVTVEPVLNEAAHVVPQLMPAGTEVTMPDPVPLLDTVSCDVGGTVGLVPVA